jgi:hypothetical protein
MVLLSQKDIKILSNGTLDPSFNAGTGTVPYFGNNANYFFKNKEKLPFIYLVI